MKLGNGGYTNQYGVDIDSREKIRDSFETLKSYMTNDGCMNVPNDMDLYRLSRWGDKYRIDIIVSAGKKKFARCDHIAQEVTWIKDI